MPIAQNTTIDGNISRYGTRNSRTQMPTSGRLMMISIRLPIHIEAIMPQTRSGCFCITCGPGTMPWMVIAPTISAITAFGGMPSVSSGMKEVCAAALLALSGAATPSIAPRPNRDGSLAIFFSNV